MDYYIGWYWGTGGISGLLNLQLPFLPVWRFLLLQLLLVTAGCYGLLDHLLALVMGTGSKIIIIDIFLIDSAQIKLQFAYFYF